MNPKHSRQSTTTPSTTPQNKQQASIPAPNEDEMSSFFQHLNSAHPTSAILSLVEPRQHSCPSPERVRHLPQPLTSLFNQENKALNKVQLKEACTSTFESMSITAEEADYLECSTKLQSCSSLWFDHRKGRITASKFAQVSRTGVEGSLSILKTVMQYTPLLSNVPAIKWGVQHENDARQEYVEQTQQEHILFECHPAGLTVHPDYPHLGASPDCLISCSCCGDGLVEIKCPYKHRDEHPHQIHDPKFCLCPVDESVLLSKKHDYYIQIQGQMAICNREYCDFVCWTPKGMHVERISFDPSVFHKIKPSLDRFFLSFVLPELLTHSVKGSVADGVTDKENTPGSVHASTPEVYCLCRQGEHGRMVACDNPNCTIEWYHYKCVGITKKPKGKWYCPS